MKIITRGVKPSDRIWFGKCSACGSTIEAKESELTHIVHDQRDGSFSWEKCPVCESGGDSGYGGVLFYPKVNK